MRFIVKPVLLTLYFIFISLIFAAFQFYTLYKPEVTQNFANLLLTPAAFTFVIADFILVAILILCLSGSKAYLKVIAYFLVILFSLVESSQFLSLYFSQGFLNPGIMANAELFTLLITPFTVSVTFVPVLFLTFGLYYYRKFFFLHEMNYRERYMGSLILIFCLIALLVLNNNVMSFHNAKRTYKAGTESPLISFFINFSQQIEQNRQPPAKVSLSQNDIEVGARYGLSYSPEQEKPFLKKQGFRYTLNELSTSSKPKNVILIFAESLSARLSGVYRPDLEYLTPNMLDFADHGLVVKNYFNHVTPTIVGVRGQLCSSFPYLQSNAWRKTMFELEVGETTCLPHILSSEGYATHFLGNSHPQHTFFDRQMRDSGFKNTLFFKDLLNKYVGENEKPERRRQGNSDRQMMTGLINFLKTNSSEKPFFVSVLTLESHPGLELLDSQQPHPQESNTKLNLIYNLDRQFGRFWNYFKNSPWRENTIVILTADHAHTASVLLREIAGDDYNNENFDQVSLQIYLPEDPTAKTMDIYSTSLDLAPSILQLLNLQNVSNSFLGNSIFGDRQKMDGGIGLIYNKRLFLASQNGLSAHSNLDKDCIDEDGPRSASDHCSIYRLIKQSHYLQSQGRL